MKTVTLRKNYAHPDHGTYSLGTTVQLPDAEADMLIKERVAELPRTKSKSQPIPESVGSRLIGKLNAIGVNTVELLATCSAEDLRAAKITEPEIAKLASAGLIEEEPKE